MDVTMQIIEAQDARSRMQEAKKRIKAEVRRKYEAQMNAEVAERTQEVEIQFAKTLAKVHASGVSQALLRRDVLRTNVWSVWTYWRDLAEIEPERKVISNAKAERDKYKAAYRWDDDQYDVLWWQHDRKGKPMDEPIRMEVDNKDRPGSPLVTREHMALVKDHHGNYNDFLRKTAAPVIFERFPTPTED